MMNISDKNLYLSLIISGLLFLLVQETQASEAGAYWNNTSHHLAQHNESRQQFELTAGESRSRVKRTLVNFLLGRTVNKYLSFGAEENNTGRKNTGRLKLRLKRHRAMLEYRYTFY